MDANKFSAIPGQTAVNYDPNPIFVYLATADCSVEPNLQLCARAIARADRRFS